MLLLEAGADPELEDLWGRYGTERNFIVLSLVYMIF